MKTLTYLLLCQLCISATLITAMNGLSPEQEKLLNQQNAEIRKILEEKAVEIKLLLKNFGLSEPVKFQYNSNPALKSTPPKSLKVLNVWEETLKNLSQETDEIKQLLAKKGINVDEILTKMGLDPKTIQFRFDLPEEGLGFACNLRKQIIIDREDLENNTADELIYAIGHEGAHLEYHQKGSDKTLKYVLSDRYSKTILSIFLACYVAFSLCKSPTSISFHCGELLFAIGGLFFGKISRALFIIIKSHQMEYFADRESVLRLNCAQGAITYYEKSLKKNKQALAKDHKSYEISPEGNYKVDFLHPAWTDRLAAIKALQQQMQNPCP